MNIIRFVDPWWLLLIAPLLAVTFATTRPKRRVSVLYSSSQLLHGLPITFAQRVKRILPWVRFCGLLFVIIATARPQAGLRQFRISNEGIAIVMCLDRSGSMEALDFELDGKRVDRLTVVKQVFRDFVGGNKKLAGRADDLIGLVTFGGFAESKAPLTFDHGALLQILDSIEIPQATFDADGNLIDERYLQEERSTAIGDALTLAVDRLKSTKAKSKIIILLSDGENTAGIVEPEAAAEAARTFGVKVYAIGIGTTGRVPFPVTDRYGRRAYVAQMVRLDETTLKMIAEKTGGQYFSAQDTAALQNVYAAIDRLEKSVSEGTLYSEYRELFAWWLLPGIVMILTEFFLRATRFSSWP